MQSFSYGVSPNLKLALEKIESLRSRILLTPLPPKVELRLRWESTISRIHWSLILSGVELKKAEVVKLCIGQHGKKLGASQREALAFKKALDYITHEWLVTSRLVTPKTVITLCDIIGSGRLRVSEINLKQTLDYIQTNSEHPVVQAALAHIQIIYLAPFTQHNDLIARLLAYVFLYKSGYDFRGFLILEEYFRRDLNAFTYQSENTLKSNNATSWLEYYAQAVAAQLEKVVEYLISPAWKTELPNTFWELNERQKTILSLLDYPDGKIINKEVQKRFKVSQITASRDLTKLATLGLLIPHGKGRSVHYTRV